MNLKKLILLDKKIKYGNEYHSFSKKIIIKILKMVKNYNDKGLEVGGYIFSEEKLKGSFHGIWTSKPFKNDVFKPNWYSLDIKNEQKNININTAKGLVYSCVWHSHRNFNTKPSRVDDKNVFNLLKDLNKNQIFSIIFSTYEIRIIFYRLKWRKLIKKSIVFKKGVKNGRNNLLIYDRKRNKNIFCGFSKNI